MNRHEHRKAMAQARHAERRDARIERERAKREAKRAREMAAIDEIRKVIPDLAQCTRGVGDMVEALSKSMANIMSKFQLPKDFLGSPRVGQALPLGASDVPPGTYEGDCGACAEANHTGGSWGSLHTCGRSNEDVIVSGVDLGSKMDFMVLDNKVES